MPKMTKEQLINNFYDKAFPKMTIREFAATQLDVAPAEVLNTLSSALPDDKKTAENQQYLEKALNYGINASGAIIVLVKTDENELKLVSGQSQRRNKVVSSNGACEEGETIAATAMREFAEELGNPSESGVLYSLINDPKNLDSVQLTNKIGTTAAEIAKRIVDEKANPAKLYINISSLYVNKAPVDLKALSLELAVLDSRLAKSASFYKDAVDFLFGDRKSELKNPSAEIKTLLLTMINQFKEHCSDSITPSFGEIFSLTYDENTDLSIIKKALEAMVDLTENNKIELLSEKEWTVLLTMNKDDLKKQGYFPPSVENIVTHKEGLLIADFLTRLRGIVPAVIDHYEVKEASLGFPAFENEKAKAKNASEAAAERVETELDSFKSLGMTK